MIVRRLVALASLAIAGVATAPACTPPAQAPSTEPPSLDAMCAHVASLELPEVRKRKPEETEQDVRQWCEVAYKSYRDEGELAQWTCRSLCLSAAQSVPDVDQCDKQCSPTLPTLACADVYLPEDVAAATGWAAAADTPPAGGERQTIGPGEPHCYRAMNVREPTSSRDHLVMFDVTVRDTNASAERFAAAKSGCEVGLAMGHVAFTAHALGDESACDKEALRRVLERAARHVSPRGEPVSDARQAPPPATTPRAPLPLAPLCPGQPDVQPILAPRKMPKGPVPSVEAMCANVVRLEAAGAPENVWPKGTTKESARKDCLEAWTPFKADEAPADWACQAQCRTKATTYVQLERCDRECAPKVNEFACNCVLREADVSEALGAQARFADSKYPRVEGETHECTSYFVVEGAVSPMHVSLYIHDSKAETKAQEGGLFLGNKCEVGAARGHVFTIVDGERSGICDKAVLQRVLDKVNTRFGD